MKCIRCKHEFDSSIPEENAEHTGHNYFACPHCGRLYFFYREIKINYKSIPNEVVKDKIKVNKVDDWGKEIVADEDFEWRPKEGEEVFEIVWDNIDKLFKVENNKPYDYKYLRLMRESHPKGFVYKDRKTAETKVEVLNKIVNEELKKKLINAMVV